MFGKWFEKSNPGSPGLIVHFGYHKAMTMLFKQVFEHLANANGWEFGHHNTDADSFFSAVNSSDSTRIHSLNNLPVNLDLLPCPFVGAHIVRDPRDLLVSGYRYHLWCNEAWAKEAPMNGYIRSNLDLIHLGLKQEDYDRSYQELLNSVDQSIGLRIELDWRRPHFEQMLGWDYNRSEILELRYEEIFGNEVSEFERLFVHFGLIPKQYQRTLKFLKQISFDQLQKKGGTGSKQHATIGAHGQWKEFLPDELQDEFNHRHYTLIDKLGYA